ncbi:MAG: T9SS type A sorting domain-containing protein [Bacteroidota bacterium]
MKKKKKNQHPISNSQKEQPKLSSRRDATKKILGTTTLVFGLPFLGKSWSKPSTYLLGREDTPTENFSVDPKEPKSVLKMTSTTTASPNTTTASPTTTTASPTTTAPPTSTTAVVPVELVFFKVVKIDDSKARLEWQTASEINNKGFEIQMSLGDLDKSWKNIGFVDGKINTLEKVNYFYEVSDLTAGVYYFRLNQIDTDGTSTFTPIRSIAMHSKDKFKLQKPYPNPIKDRSTFELTVSDGQIVTIDLYSFAGRKIKQLSKAYIGAGETQQFDIFAEGLASGFYILKITGQYFSTSEKIKVL